MKCFLTIVSCTILGLSFIDFTDSIRPDINEADSQVSHERREMMRQGVNAKDYPFSLWDNKENITPEGKRPVALVRYDIAGPYGTDAKNRIMAAIEEWNNKLGDCVYWIQNGRIRGKIAKFITRHPCNVTENCVNITNGNGCSSKIGRSVNDVTFQPEPQNMSLSVRCIYTNDPQITILHEMEHNIGMDHEHVRYDRDEHIVVNKEATKGYESEFVIPPKGQRILIGPYDFYSIMHYNLKGADFFKVLDPGIDLNRVGRGEKDGTTFTKLDMYKIRTLYGCANATLPSN